jgi:hypothetical protein
MPRRRRNKPSRRILVFAIFALVALVATPLVALLAARWFVPGDFTARVLFSETASCTARERELVAAVMKNRVRHPAFSRLPSLDAVARQPGAFSCVDDPANGNWEKSRYPARLTANERAIYADCVRLAADNGAAVPPASGPSGRPLVFYHDKSIGTPAGWSKGDWRAVREVTTPHFVFYSVVPKGR